MAADHNAFSNLIWQIADLLRGPYRPPQYERVMLPTSVLRGFDCVLCATKSKVVGEHARAKGSKLAGESLDTKLNKIGGQRSHNHSPFDFARLKDDPNNNNRHRKRAHWDPGSRQQYSRVAVWWLEQRLARRAT